MSQLFFIHFILYCFLIYKCFMSAKFSKFLCYTITLFNYFANSIIHKHICIFMYILKYTKHLFLRMECIIANIFN